MRPILLILSFVAISSQSVPAGHADAGKSLYEYHCVRCHGANGAKGAMGAKNLQKSRLSDADIVKQIQKGSWVMPSFRKKLSIGEIQELMVYVKTLRTN